MNIENDLVKKFIIPEQVDENYYGNDGKKEKQTTKDLVYFETYDDGLLRKKTQEIKETHSTDYAIMNGAKVFNGLSVMEEKTNKRNISTYWLVTRCFHKYVYTSGNDGFLSGCRPNFVSVGMRPCLNLNLNPIIYLTSIGSHKLETKPVLDKDGKELYHILEFGKFPQSKAKDCDMLENLYKDNKLKETGKSYLGRMNKSDGGFLDNKEFEFDGKKYVRVITKKSDNFSRYRDGSKIVETGTPLWVEVKPIKWIIKNWDELPKSINPKGKGTAKCIQLISADSIISGIPYYPNGSEKIHAMWQNSLPRAYFNGYNIYKEISKGNGEEQFKAEDNFDFDGNGFIEQALLQDMRNIDRFIQKSREDGSLSI